MNHHGARGYCRIGSCQLGCSRLAAHRFHRFGPSAGWRWLASSDLLSAAGASLVIDMLCLGLSRFDQERLIHFRFELDFGAGDIGFFVLGQLQSRVVG